MHIPFGYVKQGQTGVINIMHINNNNNKYNNIFKGNEE